MKNNGLLRWSSGRKGGVNGNKNWLHSPETLQKGHIAYLVKFLGSTAVPSPKGFDVVKGAIQKLSFSKQLRKAEGAKTPKVELTISVDGVAVREAKAKRNLHQYPLHRISFCADDKAEKRFFSFIAKEADSNEHTCFVFVSDKLAEEITLTIGQAFDLAYRRFLDTSGRELELRRQVAALQGRLKEAESENERLRERLRELGPSGETPSEEAPDEEPSPTPSPPPAPPRSDLMDDSTATDDTVSDDFNPRALDQPPSPPPRPALDQPPSPPVAMPTPGDDDDFDPRAEEKSAAVPRVTPPPLLPPPRPARPHEQPSVDELFGPPPPAPFAPPPFAPSPSHDDILSQFSEMKAGFSQGLTFGTGDQDFTLDSLDPLKN